MNVGCSHLYESVEIRNQMKCVTSEMVNRLDGIGMILTLLNKEVQIHNLS